MSPSAVMLDEHSVLPYLAARNIISRGHTSAQQLGGGVSNVVLAVDDGAQRLVLKQARAKLQVADDWFAPRERVLREAEGLRVLKRIDASAAPRVVDLDPRELTLTIERAPDDWTDWKAQLLEGHADPRVAAALGASLRQMQNATLNGNGLSAELVTDTDTFEVLRIQPYHLVAASRLPEYAREVIGVVERMRATRSCLVHGDYSPKNILVGGSGAWVIDFEVAQLGDPYFDPAFLSTHLLLKAIHREQWGDRYQHASLTFFDAYADGATGIDIGYLSQQIGCLLLARVAGKSPAEYLDTAGSQRAKALGGSLLTAPVRTYEQIWNRLKETSNDE